MRITGRPMSTMAEAKDAPGRRALLYVPGSDARKIAKVVTASNTTQNALSLPPKEKKKKKKEKKGKKRKKRHIN